MTLAVGAAWLRESWVRPALGVVEVQESGGTDADVVLADGLFVAELAVTVGDALLAELWVWPALEDTDWE